MSGLFYSARTGGFYQVGIHRDMPADAVPISAARHAALVAAQETGRRIATVDGRPALARDRARTTSGVHAAVTARIKAEAARRILAIASLEQQSNDNAALAVAALAGALSEQAAAALERRAAIDAVRARSNRIEAMLAGLDLAALARFDAATAFDGDEA